MIECLGKEKWRWANLGVSPLRAGTLTSFAPPKVSWLSSVLACLSSWPGAGVSRLGGRAPGSTTFFFPSLRACAFLLSLPFLSFHPNLPIPPHHSPNHFSPLAFTTVRYLATMASVTRVSNAALRASLRTPAFAGRASAFNAVRCYSAKTQVCMHRTAETPTD